LCAIPGLSTEQLKRIGPEGVGVVFVVVDSVDDEATSVGVVDGIDVVVVVFTCVVDDGVEVVACPPLVVSVVGEEVDCCVAVSAVVASEVELVKFASSVLVVVGPLDVVDEGTAVVVDLIEFAVSVDGRN
jgi:hypothetical protein